ncbi:S-adenosyl-L-methionine-dependent methyltransferase [Aspergillus karnatakaensis]|uniref:S-adenosyl-L-methionine-dependent methyltransferase n=1 Tax=Aspergillus karnatakaensis TaxID=1810916 RepID=UPI003CCD2D94
MTAEKTQVELLAEHIVRLSQQHSEKVQTGYEALEESKSIAAACTKLNALVSSPESWIERISLSYNSSAALCMLLDQDLFRLLSKNDGIAHLDTLASLTRCSKVLLRCALKEAVATHVLYEPSPETYQLNERSRYLLNGNNACWVHYLVDVGLQAAACLPQYLLQAQQQAPDSHCKTAFQLAFQTDRPFYEYLRDADPHRGERFDKGLQRHVGGTAQTSIEDVFDFQKVSSGGTVVDIGGGRGQHSIRIARQHPHLRFVIQDYERKFPSKEDIQDSAVFERLQWQQYDYFTEQPVRGADVYLLSNILMDNGPSECARILERASQAMTRPSSVLLVDDGIELDFQNCHSCYGSSMNMHMLAVLGTAFRTRVEWQALFEAVPGGLKVVQSWLVDGGRVIFQLQKTTDDC